MESPTAAMISAASTAETTLSSSPLSHAGLSSDVSPGLPYLILILRKLLLLPLRLMYRIEVFLFLTVPSYVARVLRLDTVLAVVVAKTTDVLRILGGSVGGFIHRILGVSAETAAADAAGTSGFAFTDMIQNLRRFSGFFSYVTSKWSMGCFIVALVLNRVAIYASTRRPVYFRWSQRFILRIIPIILFTNQILSLLRAIRCQTSPNYAILRYGKSKTLSQLDYAGEGGFLYNMSSFFLQSESEVASCNAVLMGHPVNSGDIPFGSFSFLWPSFLRLAFGHFVETLSCALRGRPVATEAGMSIFEHSLAFAEAETMLTSSIGLGLFGNIKPSHSAEANAAVASGTAKILTRNQVLDRLNVTPELLLIILISTCNSLTSNILDIFGKQSRYRLINTAIWGLCFMSAIIWGISTILFPSHDVTVSRFPTVCIVGFVPHLLIFIGIITCGAIFLIALFLTASSLPPDLPRPATFRERLSVAYANMQGASQIQHIRLNLHDDFYTTLVRIGYSALTAASEAVFLSEGKSVMAKKMTWLEEERLAEIMAARASKPTKSKSGFSSTFELDDGITFQPQDRNVRWQSGYAQEKHFDRKQRGTRSMKSDSQLGTVGAFQGPTRFHHSLTFFKSIFSLLGGWAAFGLVRLLEKLGIANSPRWLNKLAGTTQNPATAEPDHNRPLDFWILTDDGILELPDGTNFDVEKEMRKRETMHNGNWGENQEDQFDMKLYNWWKVGGSWGEVDASGEYEPSTDDDTTSVVSMSTNGDSEWESEPSDGRRTPTQEDPHPESSRAAKDMLFDPASLARLLNPRDRETKFEAQILSSHLIAGQEGKIMTRSRFKEFVELDDAKILTSNKSYFEDTKVKGRPTSEDEAEILEKLILLRRTGKLNNTDRRGGHTSWETGATGLGSSGPQCVVCQAAPRSIITWPCRCLCICEDCRVSLALNNFSSCVTCRREVAGFVRLWVP